jgi:branched-chain amino acid transport system permease protein
VTPLRRVLAHWRRPTPLLALAVCVVLAAVPASGNAEWITFCITMMNLIVLTYSLNMVVGLTGYLSFGHVVFWGLGAYTAGALVIAGGGPIAYNPYWLVPLGGLVALVFAALVGYPTLRLRGAYFAIATVSINIAVQTVFFNLEPLGGAEGLPLNRSLRHLTDRVTPAYYVLLALLFAAFWTHYGILKGKIGYGLRAILNDEDVAETMGVNATAYKVLIFATAAFFAGVAGAAWGIFQNFVDPDNFRLGISVDLFVIMMLGGAGTALGPLVGGVIYYVIRDMLILRFPHLHLIIFGVVIVLIVLAFPGGLIGTLRQRQRHLRAVLE